MMKRGFTIGRFITSKTNGSCLGEGKSPTTVVRRSKLKSKNLFLLNQMVLFLYSVDEGQTMNHNYYIENCLKPVVKEIWKQKISGYKRYQIA